MPEIGMNLPPVADWMSTFPWTNHMRTCRPWLNKSWRPRSATLPADPQGYPRLARDEIARTLLFREINGRYPKGRYAITWRGNSARVTVGGDAREFSRNPAGGALLFDVDTPTAGGVVLELQGTGEGEHVRGITLTGPTPEAGVLRSAFVSLVKPFKVLRFMDWMRTNASTWRRWADRTLPDHYTQATPNGVAIEWIAAVCNAAQAHCWVCVPHEFDDRSVEMLVRKLDAELDPGLKIYIQYSNEAVWNFGPKFDAQGNWCRAMGQKLGLRGDKWEQGHRYHARRAAEVRDLARAFVGDGREVIGVLDSQHGNPWVTEVKLQQLAQDEHEVDAIATAPYFGGDLGHAMLDPITYEEIGPPPGLGMTIDGVIRACREDIGKQAELTARHAALARGRGVPLLAYESGPHLVGVGRWKSNEALRERFRDVNRHSAMAELYAADVAAWEAAGGTLRCEYHLAGRYTNNGVIESEGFWGYLEHEDDPHTPKYAAAVKAAGGKTPDKPDPRADVLAMAGALNVAGEALVEAGELLAKLAGE